ncbi:dynamin family protein [Microbacterium xanthum]|uniref:dynamin family protein n=1 Tax=Microbacterium xanthum TaxID=3079794 RepID=UPI002AD3525C|nr:MULTISPECIES: dynamin family protein [unclassified Microbacterium]MDZ8170863.1 dynamin family protein [Microbacterium sp. KSW-48]MDZ8201375.1 dynamin family protein [Microbacterium sp. SSW1-59]
MSVRDDAARLLEQTRAVYADDAEATAQLDALDRRLHEPLRLALAGMVKAGKSTLLNAMLGERIAPTDAGECTRVVTWYRYADTPSVTLHRRDGEQRRLAIHRDRGRLVFELGEASADEVDWIDVGWPSSGLRSLILIDTPGIASLSLDVSARSTDFLVPEAKPSSADAIIYLMRHLHASDMKFLESFRDTAAGASQTVNAVAVLSRADEIGSGRIDSILSANKVARRYELDGDLASLALGVIPVAGLLAESARTLREDEYAAFKELAGLDREARERLLISADRFVRPSDATALGVDARRALLARFGIFGVRLATALLRRSTPTSTDFAEMLVQQSGLNELQQFVRDQFRTRAAILKIRGVLDGLDQVLTDFPRDDIDDVRAGIERIRVTAHALRELSTLARARADGLPLTPADAAEAERLIGGKGTSATARLGLADDASDEAVRDEADRLLARWRGLGQSPLTERSAAEVCRVVVRSLEEIVSVLPAVTGSPDVVLAGRPGQGAS